MLDGDWSSDVCSSDLSRSEAEALLERAERGEVLPLHARPDGRVVMGACPRSERAQTVRSVAAGMIAGAAVATAAFVPYAVVDDMRFDALAERVTEGERTAHRLYLEQHAQGERWAAREQEHDERDRLETRAHLSLRDSITSLARRLARDEAVADPPTDADGADVTEVGPNEYLVTRAALESPAHVMSAARVIPHEQDGVVLGVRIYGIRRSSLLGRMGIQNGDTLVTLNGISLASSDPNGLLGAVRDSTSFELVVLRRGDVLRLRYVVLG
jgi:hypothetical protein